MLKKETMVTSTKEKKKRLILPFLAILFLFPQLLSEGWKKGELDKFSGRSKMTFLWKTVVLFIVSSAISQSLLLSEPSQLPSQLLTGILNQQLMCSKMCLPPPGPNTHTDTLTHILAVCSQHAVTPLPLPPIPQQSFQSWSSIQNRHIGVFVPVSLQCAWIRTDSVTPGLSKEHPKHLPRRLRLKEFKYCKQAQTGTLSMSFWGDLKCLCEEFTCI